MTDTEWAQVSIVLQSKPAHGALTWDQVAELYVHVVAPIPSEFVRPLILWIVRDCKVWRPTTDMIFDWYAVRAGLQERPGSAVAAELKAAIAQYGLYGVRHPQRPRVWTVGQPDGLSEAAKRLVAERGGWAALCSAQTGDEEWYWRHVAEDAGRILEALRIESERSGLSSRKSDPRWDGAFRVNQGEPAGNMEYPTDQAEFTPPTAAGSAFEVAGNTGRTFGNPSYAHDGSSLSVARTSIPKRGGCR